MSNTIKCSRCGRRYRGHGEWNHDYRHGYVVATICPDCQTTEEHLEAAVNDAMGAMNGARYAYPGQPGYVDAMAQHMAAVTDDVWRDFLTRVIESAEPVELNPYALADETLERLAETAGRPAAGHEEEMRENIAQMFRDIATEARGGADK